METSRKLAKYDRLYDQIKQYIQTTEDIWEKKAGILDGEIQRREKL